MQRADCDGNQMKRSASDIPTQQTASAKKKACSSWAKKGPGHRFDQRQPVINVWTLSPNPAPRSTYHATSSTVQAAKQNAAIFVLLSDDVMALVTKHMDLQTAMNARAVCTSWKRHVKEAELEPLEAGCSAQAIALGKEAQKHLEEALELEKQVWTPQHTASIAQHLTWQAAITADMRKTLVNWLIEVHFKFRYREPCLHLTIQLVDRFLSVEFVTRMTYQTVGVTAFMLGVKFKEDHSHSLDDLSYITDYSSSPQDIMRMKTNILQRLKFDMGHPLPADFLERFSKAARLETTERDGLKYSKSHAITLYFVDNALLDETLTHTRPSLVAASSIMCTLRVLGRADWSKQLEHYTMCSRGEVAAVADKLIANGRDSKATALGLKYTSKRLGGKGGRVGAESKPGNNGCLHIIKAYYERTALPSQPPSCASLVQTHTTDM